MVTRATPNSSTYLRIATAGRLRRRTASGLECGILDEMGALITCRSCGKGEVTPILQDQRVAWIGR